MKGLHLVVLGWIWTAATTALSIANHDVKRSPQQVDLKDQTDEEAFAQTKNPVKHGLSNNVPLRILTLGASIAYGYPSTDGNGFRYPLRNKLVWEGNPVNMVGSVSAGSMADNQFEAYGGYTIDQIAAKAENSIPSKPNLVLLHVGTNDMTSNVDVANAHTRLGKLIDRLFTAIPDVTVIVSTLLPNSNAQANEAIFNANVPSMVKARQTAGKKLVLVDMSSSFFSMADITADGTHPTDVGFVKMAAVWYQGIKAASDAGWLTAPVFWGDIDIVGAENMCDEVPGMATRPVQVGLGSGASDGDYAHSAVAGGGYLGAGNPATKGVNWADIDGDGIDDYVYVSTDLNGGLGVALSLGGGNFGPYVRETGPLAPGACERSGVRFADMTGDGRADVCCLGLTGDIWCWQNTPGTDPRIPKWVSMGWLLKESGFSRDQVRLADLDGDGKADYVGISADGASLWGWRNTAPDNVQPTKWTPFGGAGSLPTGLKITGWRFADLNGDHRDDLLYVDDNGKVTTWINQRGLSHGLGPVWISRGDTHRGGSSPQNVTFGKMMGTGRADYATITDNPNTISVYATINKNMGMYGTAVKGDGTRYCDMTGSGADDYIWVSLMGEVTLYGNRHSWGSWNQYGVIYNVNRSRREVYFADFDGDKKCDILLVEKATGTTIMLRNDYANGKFAFTNVGIVNSGATCTAGYGYDLHDLGVRWHDIDGDGRADFLCMARNGMITGYLNKGINNMTNQGQIKMTEGRERKNFRFADINGDGRDDLVHIDMVTSAAEAWLNTGPTGQVGSLVANTSSFGWNFKGQITSESAGRGSCLEFANLYGVGRADAILVYPATNEQFATFNVCPNGGLEPVAPNLPVPPAMTWPLGA